MADKLMSTIQICPLFGQNKKLEIEGEIKNFKEMTDLEADHELKKN